MSVLEQAKAHYVRLGRKRIEVREWGPPGAPYVFFSSPMTVRQRDRIRETGNAEGAEMFVDVLIEKAETEDGQKVFSAADRHDLVTKVDSRVVSRIALEILAGPSDEILEKNSEAAGAG